MFFWVTTRFWKGEKTANDYLVYWDSRMSRNLHKRKLWKRLLSQLIRWKLIEDSQLVLKSYNASSCEQPSVIVINNDIKMNWEITREGNYRGIGTLCSITSKFEKYIKKIGFTLEIEPLQNSCSLGYHKILIQEKELQMIISLLEINKGFAISLKGNCENICYLN